MVKELINFVQFQKSNQAGSRRLADLPRDIQFLKQRRNRDVAHTRY